MKKLHWLVATAAVAVMAASSANATVTTYDFVLNGTSGALPPSPWGTVTVDDNNSGGTHLTYDVLLKSGLSFYFQDSTSFHAFDYLLNYTTVNTPTIDLPPTMAGAFIFNGLGSYDAPSLVNPHDPTLFNFSFDCPTGKAGPGDCAGGNVDDHLSELKFEVTGTGLSVASITDSGTAQPLYFASDVSYQGGTGAAVTGNIGAVLSAVPESSTWMLLIAGFGLMGFALRRRSDVEDKVAFA